MKKILGIIVIVILIILTTLFLILDKKFENKKEITSQENFLVLEGEVQEKKENHSGTLMDFEKISEEEYLKKRDIYFNEIYYQTPEVLPEGVTKEGDCLIFSEQQRLCDEIPSEEQSEISIARYKNPIYLEEQKLFLVRKSYYEGGTSYLIDKDTKSFMLEIRQGDPRFRDDNKYMFTYASSDSAYTQPGINIWSIDLGNKYGLSSSKIAEFGSAFFGQSILEAFWVEDDIYIKTDYLSYNYYLKLKIKEFPDLSRE